MVSTSLMQKLIGVIVVFSLSMAIAGRAAAGQVRVAYSGVISFVSNGAFELAVNDGFSGSLVFDADTPPFGILTTTNELYLNPILSGSFNLSRSSSSYYSGTLNPADNRIQLFNSFLGRPSPQTDEMYFRSLTFFGDLLGINRFPGDPLSFHPNSFEIRLFDRRELLNFGQGFIPDPDRLPTLIDFDGKIGSGADKDIGATFHVDWRQSGGALLIANGFLTEVSATLVAAPEPATLAIFGLGLAALGVMRRRRRAA